MVTSHRPGTTRERVLHRGERVAHEIAHDRGTERVLEGKGKGTYGRAHAGRHDEGLACVPISGSTG